MADNENQVQQAQQLPAPDPKQRLLSGPLTGPDSAAGPLVISAANPRYFTLTSGRDADRRAVYLIGSHIWNNFHDGMGPGAACAEPPELFDYDAYLAFLEHHGHTFIRLWRWEHFTAQAAGGNFHLCMTPQPWPRTGPGATTDGKPKFDLARFDPAYFDRIRERAIAAGIADIYVAVMFFEGWAPHLVLQPNAAADPFTVELAAGAYTVEWYSVDSRESEGSTLTVERSTTISLRAPFEAAGPAVVYLKQVGC